MKDVDPYSELAERKKALIEVLEEQIRAAELHVGHLRLILDEARWLNREGRKLEAKRRRESRAPQ